MNIYRITIDDLNDPALGLLAISLVDFPAVEKNFIRFKDEGQPKRITLKADEDQRVITGVALLADTPIYRYDPALGGDYYIVFERETIKQLVQKYSHDGLLNVINLQHDSETYSINSCVMIESYFTNSERGICPVEFQGIPDGSWIVSFKVTDEELWKAIKASNGGEGGLNGFSVEVCAGIAPKMRTERRETTIDEYVAALVESEPLEGPLDEFFSVTKADVRRAIDKKKQLEITIGKEKILAQIKEMGVRKGATVVNVYIPDKERWQTIQIDRISSIEVTDIDLAPWNYDLPTYDEVEDDDSIAVTDSIVASREQIEACMDGQYFAMITYDDESKEHTPATGMRQVQVCAYGTTLRGNECFRAYEYYGDTSGSLPGGVGNWRIFLTRRCRSFHVMTEAKRWASMPPGYHTGDVDMTTIYKEIDPAVIKRDV